MTYGYMCEKFEVCSTGGGVVIDIKKKKKTNMVTKSRTVT